MTVIDAEGFLENPSDWTEDVAHELAENAGKTINEAKMNYILKARELYEQSGVVPPIRKFAKEVGVDKKILFDEFMDGPMKVICKLGGLPKPTGCV